MRPCPRVSMCVRWWIGMGRWCSDWWWWRRWMGLRWRRGSYLLLSLGDLWVVFCGLRGSIVFCRRIVCHGLRRGSHVGAGTDGAREDNRARLALSLIMARPMGLRMFSSRRVPDLFLPNTAEFVAAAGSVSSIPPSMRLPEVAKTARYHSLVHEVTLFERWL